MVAFDVVLLIVFLLFAIIGASYQPTARELPFPVSIIGVLLVFLLLIADFSPTVNRVFPFLNQNAAKQVVQIPRETLQRI